MKAPDSHIKTVRMSELPIWEQAKEERTLLSVVLELTSRCNNNCNHCYINLPAGDTAAMMSELSLEQVKHIVDESVPMGTLWFVLSGGEPLLHPDFFDIYIYLKKKGMLVSVFTNGSLLTEEHVQLFKKYPPRDIEITVYGVTEEVHAKVTGKKTYTATMAGIDMLLAHGLPVTLKTTVMKSNVEEFDQIAEFCRSRSDQLFRFDPMLHLRLDGCTERNKKIIAERLMPDEICQLEHHDPARRKWLQAKCGQGEAEAVPGENKLFHCQAGMNSCTIDSTGKLKLCSSFGCDMYSYDLSKGSLQQAWEEFVPEVMRVEPEDPSYVETCGGCSMHDGCSWCPAHAMLETGKIDGHIKYFCDITHKRKETFAVEVAR